MQNLLSPPPIRRIYLPTFRIIYFTSSILCQITTYQQHTTYHNIKSHQITTTYFTALFELV